MVSGLRNGWAGAAPAGYYTLSPRKAVRFTVRIADTETDLFRVGVADVWSDPIEPPPPYVPLPDGTPVGDPVVLALPSPQDSRRLCLENRSDRPLRYRAVSPKRPDVQVRVRDGEGWRREAWPHAPVTELKVLTLPPRHAMCFLYDRTQVSSFRVGVQCVADDGSPRMIWSERIDRP